MKVLINIHRDGIDDHASHGGDWKAFIELFRPALMINLFNIPQCTILQCLVLWVSWVVNIISLYPGLDHISRVTDRPIQ